MANRLLTINIRDYLIKTPRRKRHMRLANYIRLRISKSTNVRADNIKISQELNSLMLTRHLTSMKKLKVNISIEKDKATVTPFFNSKPAAEPKLQAKESAAKPAAATATAKPETSPTHTAEKETPKPPDTKKADTKDVKV